MRNCGILPARRDGGNRRQEETARRRYQGLVRFLASDSTRLRDLVLRCREGRAQGCQTRETSDRIAL